MENKGIGAVTAIVIIIIVATVGAGAYVSLSRGEGGGENQTQQEEQAPAEFEVSNLTISPDEITIVESTTISVDVKNTGGSEGIYKATLGIDGTQVDSEEITLASGETQTISFSETVSNKGTHYVTLGGLSDNFYAWEFEIIEVGTTDYIDPDTNQENPPTSVFAQGDTVYYYAIWRQYADSFRYEDLFSLLRPNQDPSEGQEILTEGEGTIDFTEAITWNTFSTDWDTQIGTHLLFFSLVQFDETTGEQVGARVENTTFEVSSQPYEVTSLSASPESVKTGESVTITANVRNLSSSEEVTAVLELEVDGASYEPKNIPLSPEEEKSVKWTFTTEVGGSYTANLEGLSASFEVQKSWEPVALFETDYPELEETTDTFFVQGNKFKLEYAAGGDPDYGLFYVFTYPEGEEYEYVDKIVENNFSGGEVSGSSIINEGAGHYYCLVGSANLSAWAISVYEWR